MKRVLFLFLTILWCLHVNSQVSEETLKEYFQDAEFFFVQEEYVDALVDYMELYNNGFQNNANINYRIGICYLKIPGQKDKSINYLSEAVKNTKTNNLESKFKEEKAPLDAWLFLGIAYRVNYMIENAVEIFSKYLEMLPKKDAVARDYVTREIAACNLAKDFIQNPVKVKLVNLGEEINSSSSNFRAVLSGDGKSLFYMNELPFYDAIYYSKYENGSWTKPVNITPQIQSDGNQYVTSASFDGKTLLLTMDDGFNSDIWISYLKDTIWTKSEPVEGRVNTRYWESHASLGSDGKTLYFSSNQAKGMGAMDIYKSVLLNDNTWGEPQNLGSVINTSVNEDTPFITEDGKTLYFSSQGHTGMGGYDIFKSELGADGVWSKPENLGYPINSTDDDIFYFPWKNGEHALVSVFEIDGNGKEDIYEVQLLHGAMFKETPKAIEKQVEEETNIAMIDEFPEDNNVDKETVQVIIPEEKNEQKDTVIEEKTIVVEEKETVLKDVKLEKQIIQLTPVYFAFDSYVLNESGKKELDIIISFFNQNKNINIDLSGFTDAIGTEEYNKLLSEKRALSALNYLVSKGIPAKNIKTNALGETNFAAINSNSEGRKFNRRVELRISGAGSENIEIKYSEIPENLKIK